MQTIQYFLGLFVIAYNTILYQEFFDLFYGDLTFWLLQFKKFMEDYS